MIKPTMTSGHIELNFATKRPAIITPIFATISLREQIHADLTFKSFALCFKRSIKDAAFANSASNPITVIVSAMGIIGLMIYYL